MCGILLYPYRVMMINWWNISFFEMSDKDGSIFYHWKYYGDISSRKQPTLCSHSWEAERLLVLSFEMTSGPCLTLNGTTTEYQVIFLVMFSLGLLILAHSYVAQAYIAREREYENEVDPEGETEHPGGAGMRGAGGQADGPRGALGFHYAKPQMESCDRVSLRGRLPKAHTMAPVARLLRCNVT